MEDFPSNSRKAQGPPTEPKKLERVTSAEAVRRKRGVGRQIKETFIEGSAKTALDYMVRDVIIPEAQATIVDALKGGIEKLILGESRSRRGHTPPSSYAPKINYGAISRSPPTSGRPPAAGPTLSRRGRASHDFGEIVIASRREAEDVLERMFDVLGRYDSVAVADLYDLVGIEPNHVDYKWGWTELRGAKVIGLKGGRDGYLVDLPEPQQLG